MLALSKIDVMDLPGFAKVLEELAPKPTQEDYERAIRGKDRFMKEVRRSGLIKPRGPIQRLRRTLSRLIW